MNHSLAKLESQEREPIKGSLRKQFVVDCCVCYKVQIIPMYPQEGPCTPTQWLERHGWKSRLFQAYGAVVTIYTCSDCVRKTIEAQQATVDELPNVYELEERESKIIEV